MLGSVISAVGNVVGGLIGQRSEEKMAAKNIAAQKEFAQQGIRWKVEDAKAAGLHPLAALGAQTNSFSNVVGSNSLGTGLAAAGQDIGRAIDSTRSQDAKVDAYTQAVQGLQLQRLGLENDLLKTQIASQIAKTRQAGNPPAMPNVTDRYLVEGQGNTPLVKDEALERVNAAPGHPSVEAGAVTDMGYARTATGWAPVRSKDFQERSEEDTLASIYWNLRNRLAPSVSASAYNPPPNVPRDPDEMWIFNPALGEYQLIKKTRRGKYGFDRWYQ